MRIDLFFILSGRGDSLVSKCYKRDVPRGCADMYYRQVQFGRAVLRGDRLIHEEPPPIFVHENLFQFVHLQRNGLYFVAVIDKDSALSTNVLSWLHSFSKTVQDFLGTLCEDSVRANIVMLYELLDESVDPSGNFKTTDPGSLQSKVYSTPHKASNESSSSAQQIINQAADALSTAVSSSGIDLTSFKRTVDSFVSPKTLPAYASHRPIMTSDQKSEVFLDLIENITTVIAPDGVPQVLLVSGNMLVKSFLNWAKPVKLKVQFPDGLFIGKKGAEISEGLGGLYRPTFSTTNEVVLDHALFDASVDIAQLASAKTIYVDTAIGERTLMSYRVGRSSRPENVSLTLPIGFKCNVKRIRKNYVELSINLTPNGGATKSGAGSVIAMIPIPPELVGISCSSTFSDTRTSKTFVTVAQLDGHNAWDQSGARVSVCDYERDKNRVVWKIPKFNANECATLKIQIDLPAGNSYSENKVLLSRIGPMRLYFDLPSYTASRLQIKSLRLVDGITGREIDPNEELDTRHGFGSLSNVQSSTNLSLSSSALMKPQSNHYRWVRYLTKASSYICNLGL